MSETEKAQAPNGDAAVDPDGDPAMYTSHTPHPVDPAEGPEETTPNG